jgi:hypothetical protein
MKRFLFILVLVNFAAFAVNAQQNSLKRINLNNVKEKRVDLSIQKKEVSTSSNAIIKSITNQKDRTVLSEGFEGTTFPPAEWKVINNGDSYTWYQESLTPNSGNGDAAIMYSGFAHDDYLVTPKLTITAGNDSISLWIKSWWPPFPEPYDIMVSTTGNNPEDFTLLITEPDPGIDWIQKTYDLSAYIGQNIYVTIRSFSDNGNYLLIDDVTGPPIFAPDDDIAVVSLDFPQANNPGQIVPKATIKNHGSLSQTYTVEMTINDGSTNVYNETINVANQNPGESTQFTFPEWTAALGLYNTKVKIINPGDLDTYNDSIVSTCNIVEGTFTYGVTGGCQAVKFTLEDPATFYNIGKSTLQTFIGSGTWINGEWYVGNDNPYFNGTLYKVDILTGIPTAIGVFNATITGLSYDDASSTLYGVGNETYYSDMRLFSIDMNTGVATAIGNATLEGMPISLACDGYGNLYCTEINGNKFYSINKSTGVFTEIATLNIDIAYGQDMEFDKTTNTLYYALCPMEGSTGLYTVNVNTGELTHLQDWTKQLTGFAIPYSGDVAIGEKVKSDFIVYPNPTNGSVTIPVTSEYRAEVYDITGKLILATLVNTANHSLDLSSNKPGVYFVKLVGKDMRYLKVIVK